jgi:hypothetical protein
VTTTLTDASLDTAPNDFTTRAIQVFHVADQVTWNTMATVYRWISFDRPGGGNPTTVADWTIEPKIPNSNGLSQGLISDPATSFWKVIKATTSGSPSSSTNFMLRAMDGSSQVSMKDVPTNNDIANVQFVRTSQPRVKGIFGINGAFTPGPENEGQVMHSDGPVVVTLPPNNDTAVWGFGTELRFLVRGGPITFVGTIQGPNPSVVADQPYSEITVVSAIGSWMIMGPVVAAP